MKDSIFFSSNSANTRLISIHAFLLVPTNKHIFSNLIAYIYIRAAIGGGDLPKGGGGDLKVQKDQNFGQKLPQKTNFRRRRSENF